MATYIQLVKWTDQGIRTLHDVPRRERAAKARAADAEGTHTTCVTFE